MTLPQRRVGESTNEYLERIDASGALDEHVAGLLTTDEQHGRRLSPDDEQPELTLRDVIVGLAIIALAILGLCFGH